MTKEVVEKIVRGIKDKIECNTVDIDDWAEFWGFTREEYEEFLDTAIKALEQQPILDKIRAEIENHCGLAKEERCKYCYHCNNVMGVREILKIIDKYRESEEV